MNEKLKDAVITIAGYDGWKIIDHSDTKSILFIRNGKAKYISNRNGETSFTYHTSADALLDVWRKVKAERHIERGTWTVDFGMHIIGTMILKNNLTTACIELAEIIKQLKEKV